MSNSDEFPAPPPGCTPRDRMSLKRCDPYYPMYAERRCGNCGSWRGQHIGCSANDDEMRCPEGTTTFQTA
jgi:hypothetical protein